MSLEITAMLSKVIFVAEDSGFTVAEFIDCQSARKFKATSDALNLGKNTGQQRYKLFGEWWKSPKHGETFKVTYSEPLRPKSLDGLKGFLTNNVRGVGEKTASQFIKAMNLSSMDALLDICRERPELIRAHFKGKSTIAEGVIAALTGDESFRDVMMFLHENNISPQFARKIFDRYGTEAVDLLKENPYRLIRDFRQVGFKKADAIAQKLGVAGNSRFRVEACILYTLERALDDGHCCLPRDELIQRAVEVLSSDGSFEFAWVLEQVREIYRAQRASESHSFVIRQDSLPQEPNHAPGLLKFYLPEVLQMEDRAAQYCLERIRREGIGNESAESTWGEDAKLLKQSVAGVPWEKLSDEQSRAVFLSAHSRFMILTGGPGCGKTFVLKSIYQVQQHFKRQIALCAPTGLAAKKMTQSIGAKAFTLHKLLGLGRIKAADSSEETTSSDEHTLALADTVICDEASMLSLDLFHALLEAMTPNQRLILVGDVDQLPSVGPGQCLRDLIDSGTVPVCRLTRIFRQAGASPIPVAAREIISGQLPQFECVVNSPELPDRHDLVRLHCNANSFFEQLIPFLTCTVRDVYGLDPVSDVQILVPMRKGPVGQDEVNRRLQETLNPSSTKKNEFIHRKSQMAIREGDKVIQTRNNYEKDVFNGDMGFVKVIRTVDKKVEIDVQFAEKRVRLQDEEVDDLQLCYAMTIHKSQGSEFPLCVIPVFSSYYTMLYRNLLYTAVTRASRSALIIGEDWALKRGVRNASAAKRHTALRELIENS